MGQSEERHENSTESGWISVCPTVLFHSCLSSTFARQPTISILFRSSSSSSSIHSTTLGVSRSVQQFYSTPVCPLPSPSNQQFSSSLGLLLPGPSTLIWVSLLVFLYGVHSVTFLVVLYSPFSLHGLPISVFVIL